MPQKIYVAGPITGVRDWQKRHKHACEQLRSAGYTPVSSVLPECLDGTQPQSLDHGVETWMAWLAYDLKLLNGCDGIALMPGWHTSRGAFVEQLVAKRYLNLAAHSIETWLDNRIVPA